MRKYAIRAALTTAAAVVASSAVAMPAANAAETCGVATTGAWVCFVADGDLIKVQDTSADGHRAVGNWYTSDGRSGTCHNTLGKGQWKTCNYDFSENATVTYRAEVREGTTLIRSSSWRTDTVKGCPSGQVCSG
ncbi:hypothetical protein ACIQRK_10020 [Streptomyces anulatus]